MILTRRQLVALLLGAAAAPAIAAPAAAAQPRPLLGIDLGSWEGGVSWVAYFEGGVLQRVESHPTPGRECFSLVHNMRTDPDGSVYIEREIDIDLTAGSAYDMGPVSWRDRSGDTEK